MVAVNESKNPKFREALKFIREKHAGQVRKFDHKPYIVHPIRVSKFIKKFKGNSKHIDELMIAALLHDTLEDTNTTVLEIKKKFGNLVASLVKELTSDADKIEKLGKSLYLSKKMTEELTDYALVLKLADRLDNTNDFKIADPKFVAKYAAETGKIIESLEKRELTSTQKNILEQIKKNVQKAQT